MARLPRVYTNSQVQRIDPSKGARNVGSQDEGGQR